MSDRPKVVAVVLNWCGEEMAAACIRSLQEDPYPNMEILLVDNGSPDGSGDRLHARLPDIPFLQTGENLGYTGGNNRGIARALERGADYVLILNHDTTVEAGAVGRLVATCEEEESVGGVCPSIVYFDAPERIWYGGGDFSALRGLGVHRRVGVALNGRRAPEPVTFLSGCALLCPAVVFREVGTFAPEFFAYVEDADLSLRLRRAGWKLLHEPRARVRHRKPTGEHDPPPFAIVLRDRNRRRLMRTHYGRLSRIPFWGWYWTTRVGRLIQYAVRGDRERVRAILEGMKG